MAKSRVSINPMYTGGAGGFSFYVRGGEQVVRQRKNNSNYGESASRTYAQMIRRIMWGNLVNIYKSMKSWQKKAYDSKLAGQTDYNLFIKLNINNCHVGVTKQACEQGFGVFEQYQISNGSLPPIVYSVNTTDHRYTTDIIVKQAVLATTTIGDLSADILANNPQFQSGDNIAFIFFNQQKSLGVDWPYPWTTYAEITLNPSDTRLVADIPELGERLTENLNDTLDVTYTAYDVPVPSQEVGFACIHTRKTTGVLSVSTQYIALNTTEYTQQYSGQEWYQHCIESYGLDEEVPLDPSFREGIISRVTANDATVSNADVLQGSQTVRVYGTALAGSGYRLVHNGIEYTPLSSTDEYDEYILTANGAYVIYIGERVFLSFNIAGIVMPVELSGQVAGGVTDGAQSGVPVGNLIESNTGCVNVPIKVSTAAPYMLMRLYYSAGVEELELEDFTLTNADRTSFGKFDLFYRMNVQPTDPNAPVTIAYKDFIVFVGNYSA